MRTETIVASSPSTGDVVDGSDTIAPRRSLENQLPTNERRNGRNDYVDKKTVTTSFFWWPCSIIRDVVLTINALLHIPMYAMILCFTLYLTLLYSAPSCCRLLLLLYHTYIIFDPTPSQGGWDEDTNGPFMFLHKILPSSFAAADSSMLRGGWKLRTFFRSTVDIRAVSKYFHMELVKTVDLHPNRNYLFLYHPHGVIAMGANTALSTNGCGFEEKFPGIRRSGTTLNVTFRAPFYRDWLLMIGFISANRTTLLRQLKTTRPFYKSVVLVPGGASEALHARPGIFRAYLKHRKGFIRVALETGSSLVPCLGFGENEIFTTVGGDCLEEHDDSDSNSNEDEDYVNSNKSDKGNDAVKSSSSSSSCFYSVKTQNIVFNIQKRLQRALTFTVPIWTHFIPHRAKITVVVGEPLHVERMEKEKITMDIVDKYHQLYIDQLRKLYDTHKKTYGVKGVELAIV